MRIYAVQYDICWEDKAANHHRVRTLLREANLVPGSMVCLPEMFDTGFSMNVEAIAEDTACVSSTFLAEMARSFQVYVLGGIVRQNPAGQGMNLAVIFQPDGELLASYQKVRTFTPGGETERYERGTRLVIANWLGASMAPLVCYDLRFPELFRAAVYRGAEVIVLIANWPSTRAHHWRCLLQARAMENQCYIIGVNRSGKDPFLTYLGLSCIFSPHGEVLAEAGDQDTVLQAEIDLDELRSYRTRFPILSDMLKPSEYTSLL